MNKNPIFSSFHLFIFSFVVAVSAATTLFSCGDPNGIDKPVNPGEKFDLSDECEWIYNELCENYYWRESVLKATPKQDLAYDKFLDNLLRNLKGASDTSETPPTIDGYFDAYGDRYIYSYIERTPASTRADALGRELSFGFGFEVFRKSGGGYVFLITWVQEDGPAYEAGVRRGMFITEYNGGLIDADRYYAAFDQVYYMDESRPRTMTLTDDRGGLYNLEAENILVDPILFHDVITTSGGKRVGYLVYNQFEPGEIDQYDYELVDIFTGFKSAGVTELVVDLRYNPGGYVTSCLLLTNLAGAVDGDDVFAKLLYADGVRTRNPEIIHYGDYGGIPAAARLGLDKVYAIATENSASASEMFINGLRGNLGNGGVIHIGTKTNGKNVGMDRVPGGREDPAVFDKYEYTMWPITFKVLNAVDFCDYAGGFTPDYRLDEFDKLKKPGYQYGRDTYYEFGDRREKLLAAALALIDGKTPAVSRTRADDNADYNADSKTDVPRLIPTHRGGAKIVRGEDGEIL